ncbi:MAG: 3'(2'),5'-bisphosphate nucleotidase CysQ [Pseudomonadales bacterium]|nr:3'(2'),5'-bisphosphate nucleotidase CysQ [Pseudomonadales bacterium]
MELKLEAELIEITKQAGDAILAVYSSDFEVKNKADESPLTQADLAAHEIIAAGLARVTPDIPVISEESEPPSYDERKTWGQYWLVDPLDGTKEFVNRNGEFTVNIALIQSGQPIWGIVGVPVQERIFIGDVESHKATLIDANGVREIRGREMSRDTDELVVVASRSHGGERLETYLDELATRVKSLSRTPVGSSLKLCVLASGEADCYPRLGPTSEWDIGAAHAVLRAAGGDVYQTNQDALTYNAKESFLNPEFVAVADSSFDWWGLLPDIPPMDGA